MSVLDMSSELANKLSVTSLVLCAFPMTGSRLLRRFMHLLLFSSKCAFQRPFQVLNALLFAWAVLGPVNGSASSAVQTQQMSSHLTGSVV